jgi:tetratricopeptide (TPR) repeat protein
MKLDTPSEQQSFRDLLWQARLLFVAKKDQEAFAKVQDAINKAPAEPEPYVAQVQFFHARGRDIDARKTTKEAEAQIQADTTERKAQRALALALCYETVGDVGQAATSYSEALTCGGNDMNVIRGVCSFYLKYGHMEEVGPLLETVVSGRVRCSSADLEWARQSLAYVLSATTDFSRFRRALDLVGVKLDDDGKLMRDTATDESTDAVRAKARVLATQPQPQFRVKAIELLVQLKERQSLLADDRFVLAMLYEGQGDATGWGKAREELDAICRPISQNEGAEYLREAPRYMSRYVQGLIRHNDLVVARQWLANLETLEKQREVPPGTFGSVELQARLLEAEKRGDEAIKVLNAHIHRQGAQPSEVLLVVASYQRQMRWKEGFELLDQQRDKIAPELVGGYYVSLMYGLKPTDVQCEKVESWLKTQIAAREKEAQSLPNTRDKEDAKNRGVALQMHLAALYDLRGRYPDAEGQYKKILQIEPNNIVALNNLAWLRAAQQTGEGNAALRDINTAIAGMGRQSLLLDTRGLVYMALNQNDKALADFKEAAEDAPTPTVLFHLARAHNVVKDKNAAEAVLREARKAGLEPAKLHPVEQSACNELLKELHVQ